MSRLFKEWLQSTGIGLPAGVPKPKPFQQTQDKNLAEEASHFQWETKKDDARGLVFPGYKYLGPFNGLDKGEPVNAADAAAKKHDEAYNELLQQGENPYISFNHADHQFQKDLAGDTSFGGNLARGVFQAKKRVLEPLGLVEPDDTGPIKKPRIEDETSQDQPKLTAGDPKAPVKKRPSNSAAKGEPSAKRQLSFVGGETGSSGSAGNMSNDIEMSAVGGDPGRDAGQGSEGVGTSSGNWHCDSSWGDGTVTTKSTRTWVLPTYNNHKYKRVSTNSAVINQDKPAVDNYNGFSTPWGYFDFNRFHCHFSPRDWQRLINNNWGIRPKGMRVKIFNIQVKEVTTESGSTTVANNLTSTIQIFADSSYELPYVMDAGQEGSLPAFPNDVFMVPQYGYCGLVNGGNSGHQTDRCAFYCLEYFPSQMLRTGNNFEMSYKFESVPFHSTYAHSQSLDRLMNPLLDQYFWRLWSTKNAGTSTKAVRYRKNQAPAFNSFNKNWIPGPMVKQQTWTNDKEQNRGNDPTSLFAAQTQFMLDGRANLYTPGTCMGDDGRGTGNNRYTQTQLMFPSSTAQRTHNTDGDHQNVDITSEEEVRPTNPTAGATYGKAATNTQTSSIEPGNAAWDAVATMPGMVWQNRDIYLQGPIWSKIPHTDGSFHCSPLMGGFGLRSPPPQIFIKNTPVPGNPNTTFSAQKIESFITQYSTGQVTVEIDWEIKKETSKRWNPEIQFTSNFGDAQDLEWAPNDQGVYVEPRPIGTRYLTHNL